MYSLPIVNHEIERISYQGSFKLQIHMHDRIGGRGEGGGGGGFRNAKRYVREEEIVGALLGTV